MATTTQQQPGNGPPSKPWERVGSSSGPTPFRPSSSGTTSDVVETSGTAKPGEIVSTSNQTNNTVNTNIAGRPLPTRPWENNYGNTSYGGYGSGLTSGVMGYGTGYGSGMYNSYGGGCGGLGGVGGMYGNSMYRGGYGGSGMYGGGRMYGGGGMYNSGIGGSMGGYGMGGPDGPLTIQIEYYLLGQLEPRTSSKGRPGQKHGSARTAIDPEPARPGSSRVENTRVGTCRRPVQGRIF